MDGDSLRECRSTKKVVAIFMAIWPALPMPEVTSLPPAVYPLDDQLYGLVVIFGVGYGRHCGGLGGQYVAHRLLNGCVHLFYRVMSAGMSSTVAPTIISCY